MTMGTSVLCNEFDLWEYLRRVDFQVQTSVAGPQAILGVIDSLKEPLMVILAKGNPAEQPLAIGTPQCPLFICQGSPVYTLLYDMHLICDRIGYLDPLRGMYVFRPFFKSQGNTYTCYALPGNMYLAAHDVQVSHTTVSCMVTVLEDAQQETRQDARMDAEASEVQVPAMPLLEGLSALSQELPGSWQEEVWEDAQSEQDWDDCNMCRMPEHYVPAAVQDQVADAPVEEGVLDAPPGDADLCAAVPPEWYRWEISDDWDEQLVQDAATGAGAWQIPAQPPVTWRDMSVAYSIVREVLGDGRLACLPIQVRMVEEAARNLSMLVQGKLGGTEIPLSAVDWLEES
jgi:hypothetical protein